MKRKIVPREGRMRVYITGGTGFIGSYVLKEMANGRDEIIVLARNPGKVPALRGLPGTSIVKAPMHDRAAFASHGLLKQKNA